MRITDTCNDLTKLGSARQWFPISHRQTAGLKGFQLHLFWSNGYFSFHLSHGNERVHQHKPQSLSSPSTALTAGAPASFFASPPAKCPHRADGVQRKKKAEFLHYQYNSSHPCFIVGWNTEEYLQKRRLLPHSVTHQYSYMLKSFPLSQKKWNE